MFGTALFDLTDIIEAMTGVHDIFDIMDDDDE